jgi:uncharacterized protein (TIGR02145 family)
MKKNYLILLALVATFQATLQAQTVNIGTQIWTTTNLNVDTYSDGTPIPQVTNPTAWTNLTTGAWCYYNNDPALGAIYGKMYNWYAAVGIYDAASLADPSLRKNLAPTGYHIPTDPEWTTLTTYLGVDRFAKMQETGNAHWNSPYNNNATNSSGFTGLPGGEFYPPSQGFHNIGNGGYFWSSTEYPNSNPNYDFAWFLPLTGNRSTYYKAAGFSVRCLSNQLLKTEDHAMKLQVKLYPNPATNTLHLQTANNSNPEKITITDLTGKVVLIQTTNTTQVNVASLASGLYVMEAVSGQEKFTSKFIKD